ncbi:hypothetical protein E4U13_008380 [Claviceps humidiphila]|uniref:BZIP domain-containing protein n=1 Tax=Claviceps humidiphila TaxID=1294629 RepID=A0A9P7PV84_9HYPO|nr:hypothetical protein E4U13_008380 [Claviceps humidiphila]
MATLGVRFDGMFPGAQPHTQDELFQQSVINEMNLLEDFNDSTMGLPDFCPATPGIVSPMAREQLVDPLNFVSDRHYHRYPDHQHQHQERAYSQQGLHRQDQWRQEYHQQEQQEQQQQRRQQQQHQHQQQQLFRPYYHKEQQYACLPGHIEAPEHSSDARPGIEISNATPGTTLTWATTPTTVTQSPIPSSPFQNDHQANNNPYSPAEHLYSFCSSSSQVELGTNPTQSTRNLTEKSPSPRLTAATSGRRKGSQTTLQGSNSINPSRPPRKRSKEWIRYIEFMSSQLEDRYFNLKAEREHLLEETLRLKSDLIAHAQCRDARLDAWISHEAHKFVGTAGSPGADAQPSPTEGVDAP